MVRDDWEAVFWRMPSRRMVTLLPPKPRVEYVGIDPNCVPPVMPTAASTASTAVRKPRACITSWVMTDTLAGISRSVRPSREPVPTGASIGSENVFSFSDTTSTRSSWTTGCATAAIVKVRKLSGSEKRDGRIMAGPWWERKDRWRKDGETDRETGFLAGAAWSRMLLGARGAREGAT